MRLKWAKAEEVQVVADRAAQRQSIEGQLAERNRLLASIKDQIASLEAAERLRQERAAAEARARLSRVSAQAQDQSVQIADSFSIPGDTGRFAAAPRHATAGWSGSRCSTWVFRMSGAARARPASIAPASSRTSIPRWVCRSHTMRPSQFSAGSVSREALEPGDLVFFNGLGHVGIYIGGGQFVHAPHTGDVVKVSSLSDSWYAATGSALDGSSERF